MVIITNALINSIFDGSIHTNLPSDLIDFCSLSNLRPFCSTYLRTMMITTYNSTICRYICKQHKCRFSKLVFSNIHHLDCFEMWRFQSGVFLHDDSTETTESLVERGFWAIIKICDENLDLWCRRQVCFLGHDLISRTHATDFTYCFR